MASNEDYLNGFEALNKQGFQILHNFSDNIQEYLDFYDDYQQKLPDLIKDLQISHQTVLPKTPLKTRNRNQTFNATIYDTVANVGDSNTTGLLGSAKPRRVASQMATKMINQQVNMSVNKKLRRPTENDLLQHQKVINTVNIKEEQDPADKENVSDNMPPPASVKPARTRKKKNKTEVVSSDTESEGPSLRSSRIAGKIKKEPGVVEEKPIRRTRQRNRKEDSDVILQEQPVEVISLLDTDEEMKITDKNMEEHTEEKKTEQKEINTMTEKDRNSEHNSEILEKETTAKNKISQSEKALEIDKSPVKLSPERTVESNEKIELNNVKNILKHERRWTSEEDEEKQPKKRTKKATKKTKTKQPRMNKKSPVKNDGVPFAMLINIKQEKSIYEDALSDIVQADFAPPQTPTICDATVTLHPCTNILNETVSLAPGTFINATFVKEPNMDSTVTLQNKTSINESNFEKNLLEKHGFSNCFINLGNKMEKPVIPEQENSNLLDVTVVLDKLQLNETVTVNNNVSDETVILNRKENETYWQRPDIEKEVPEYNDSLITNDDSVNDEKSLGNEKLKTADKAASKQLTENQTNVMTQQAVSKSQQTGIIKTTEITKKIETTSKARDGTPGKQEIKQKKLTKAKPLFSPYANSPVKKRAAAFEKLGAAENVSEPTTMRVTRTKTKKMVAEKEKEEEMVTKIPTVVKQDSKLKYTTPISNNKLKSLIPSTDNRIYKPSGWPTNKPHNISTTSSATESFVKSNSAMKLTRIELQEKLEADQKRKLEKEDEAKRKKEALIQAKIEEQKRIREEKQIRAQKVREERERQKEEKLRQYLAEKEEKLQEEQQKKKAWLTQKAMEAEEQRKIVEANRLAKLKEQEDEQKRLMMQKQREEMAKKKNKIPKLPTEDCEDSDSDDETVRPRAPGPIWGQRPQLYPKLWVQRLVPSTSIKLFFNIQPTTPDLQEIFETIDRRLLKRNSSAVWRTPPRYSQLPKF